MYQCIDLLFTYPSEEVSCQVQKKCFIFIGSRDQLVIQLVLHRNFKYFLMRDYLPCIFVVMLSWIGFWISFKATAARVSLGKEISVSTQDKNLGGCANVSD